MAQISMRMDDDLKKKAEDLFDDLGLSMSAAFTIFVKQSLRQGGLPFEVTTDPFYSERNIKVLRDSIEQAEKGQFISKTVDELLAIEE